MQHNFCDQNGLQSARFVLWRLLWSRNHKCSLEHKIPRIVKTTEIRKIQKNFQTLRVFLFSRLVQQEPRFASQSCCSCQKEIQPKEWRRISYEPLLNNRCWQHFSRKQPERLKRTHSHHHRALCKKPPPEANIYSFSRGWVSAWLLTLTWGDTSWSTGFFLSVWGLDHLLTLVWVARICFSSAFLRFYQEFQSLITVTDMCMCGGSIWAVVHTSFRGAPSSKERSPCEVLWPNWLACTHKTSDVNFPNLNLALC